MPVTNLTAAQISRLNKESPAFQDIQLGTRLSEMEIIVDYGEGVTPGEVTASKAIVVGENKEVDELAIADLKLGAGAGTSITATAAEINKLASAGAIVASGTQAEVITDPTGGTTTDAEARTAINAIVDALQAFGIVAVSE